MLRHIFLSIIIFLIYSVNILNAQECWDASKKYNYKFKLLKVKSLRVDTLKVKVNGVYITEQEEKDLDGKTIRTYYFYRFFDNGKMYASSRYCSFPTDKDFNNLKYGFYREYRIEGDMIVTEGYTSWRGYFFNYYKIKDDKIFSIGNSDRKFTKNLVINYYSNPYRSEYRYYKCNVFTKSFW